MKTRYISVKMIFLTLPYLNQNTCHSKDYIFKVNVDLPYLNQHTHTVIVTRGYIFNLLNLII